MLNKAFTKTNTYSYLKCLRTEERAYVVKEIHEGVCGESPQSPHTCDKSSMTGVILADHLGLCNRIRKKVQSLPTILLDRKSSCNGNDSDNQSDPFCSMGVRPPRSCYSRLWAKEVSSINYLMKWIEAEPLVSTTWKNVNHFVWKSIMCRFRAPRVITDNGHCLKFETRVSRTSVTIGISAHTSRPSHTRKEMTWQNLQTNLSLSC